MHARTVQPGLTFEYTMWVFTRFSGAALIMLGLIGMFSAFALGARSQMDLSALLRWTFFPNPNHVVNTDIPDVTLGWANAFWQIMQILIVSFGITHGVNGLRMVAEDFTGRTLSRPLVRGTLFILWIFLLMVSIYVILAS